MRIYVCDENGDEGMAGGNLARNPLRMNFIINPQSHDLIILHQKKKMKS